MSTTLVCNSLLDIHMPFKTTFGLSKRRQAPTPSSPLNDIEGGHLRKKPKLVHPRHRPPEFYDNLSQIPLERRALEEHQRRIEESAFSAPDTPQRPRTRLAAAESCLLDSSEYLEQSDPARQSRIRRLARKGGPDLSDLRGFCIMSQSSLGRRKRGSTASKQKSASGTTTKTKSTSPYDRGFQQHLTDYGIFANGYRYPDGSMPPEPENLAEITAFLARRRPSLSSSGFTEEDFREFRRANDEAAKEWEVVAYVIPIIEGKVDRTSVSGQIPFSNLEHLTDGTLVAGNPDRYYGARPELLDREIRTALGHFIVPSTQHDLPILPNAILAIKGPSGSPAVAQQQACYDGALGARAMHSILTYGDPNRDVDGKGRVIKAIYHDGQLKLFTTFLKKSDRPDGRFEYVSAQLGAYALTGNVEHCREGINAFRQGLAWAKRERDEAIEQANLRARSAAQAISTTDNTAAATATSSFLTPSRAHEPESSADELALEESKSKRGRRSTGKTPRGSAARSRASAGRQRRTRGVAP